MVIFLIKYNLRQFYLFNKYLTGSMALTAIVSTVFTVGIYEHNLFDTFITSILVLLGFAAMGNLNDRYLYKEINREGSKIYNHNYIRIVNIFLLCLLCIGMILSISPNEENIILLAYPGLISNTGLFFRSIQSM